MSTRAEIVAKWKARQFDALAGLGLVPLGDVAQEVLADLAALEDAAAEDVLSLTAAALVSGYSADWLQKQVAAGVIQNAGRRGKPAIRRADLPRKPGHALRAEAETRQLPARRRIVHAARHPRST